MSEALAAVGKINVEILDHIDINDDGYHSYFLLGYSTDGCNECINFLGAPLWTDANDCRPEIADDVIMPLEDYIHNEVLKAIKYASRLFKMYNSMYAAEMPQEPKDDVR